jgi:thiol-disulfide isomerase/thioredoxin
MEKITRILLALLVLCGFGLAISPKSDLMGSLPTKNIYGKPIVYDKQYYLIDVWATWCPPCKMTVPELIALQKDFVSKNFTVIGLSVDDTVEPVLSFAKTTKINYPVAMASGQALNALPSVRGIPTMFIVENGKVVKTIVGYTPKETLAEELRQRIK